MKELVGSVDLPLHVLVAESAFGLMRVGILQRSCDIGNTEAHGVEQHGIDLHANGGPGAAPDFHLTDSFDLREFLGQNRIGEIIHLRPLDEVRA